jgi:hypothetical protein
MQIHILPVFEKSNWTLKEYQGKSLQKIEITEILNIHY